MAVKNEPESSGPESEYEPDDKSTTAALRDGSAESDLSDLSEDEFEDSDSSEPTSRKRGGKGKGKGKGKSKAPGKFAGTGNRLDGLSVADINAKSPTAHVGYVERWDGEESDDYDRRCYARFHNDIYAVENQEFKKQERRLKREVGRKLTNGEKNSIRLVKVSLCHCTHAERC